MLGLAGAIWGVTGLSLLLAWALTRLAPYMVEIFELELLWYHWFLLVLNVFFMAYMEGYKGFQKSAAPNVAARVRHLYLNPNLLHVVLSPLFCGSYFHATRARIKSRYILTVMIVLLIIGVGYLEQPWRGIVDAGVLVGLAWGMFSIIYFSIKALLVAEFDYSPQLPE